MSEETTEKSSVVEDKRETTGSTPVLKDHQIRMHRYNHGGCSTCINGGDQDIYPCTECIHNASLKQSNRGNSGKLSTYDDIK